MTKKPKVGDERFRLESILAADVEAEARRNGWDGGEGILDCAEPQDVATYSCFSNLADATEYAKTLIKTGHQFWGCVLIDREVLEQPRDDRGRSVRMPPHWERQETFEVAGDLECMEVAR
jgi:hypothetical protein